MQHRRTRKNAKVCSSGSAVIANRTASSPIDDRNQTMLALEIENPVRAKIIDAPSGFSPYGAIYIRGNPNYVSQYADYPQPTAEVFDKICAKHRIDTEDCRLLLQDLTRARLILGYKHPLVKYPNGQAKGTA